MADAVAGVETVPDDGDEEGRQPVGGVHHLALQGVAHRLTGEALLQGPAVGLQVDPGNGAERRQGLVTHVAADEPGQVLVPHGLVHHGVPGEQAEVAQRLVGGVEQAQLHPLVGGDVLDDVHSDLLEGRPSPAEPVLDHPLDEGLRAHGPGVLDAEALGEFHPGAIGGRGRDAVDHGAGEVDVLVDPGDEVGDAAQREAAHGLPGDCAVVRQVVAAHDRRAPGAGEPTALERGDDKSQGAARRVVAVGREIREHGSGTRGELARAVCLIPSLGDRHGDDPGLRR